MATKGAHMATKGAHMATKGVVYAVYPQRALR
jgi:hypothetical protein